MASYISSNANRFYGAIETSYGAAAAITQANRFPAVQMQAQQFLEPGKRLDKTGTRTFAGTPTTARRSTAFEVRTYLTSWNGLSEPGYGPLFQGALGCTPQLSSGLTIASVESAVQLATIAAHGLTTGSGISYLGEIRFVTSVADQMTININAPFSNALAAGSNLSAAITYRLSTALPSLTLYDYWDPANTVSRIVTGAGVDRFTFSVNGDYHEFAFSGPACDVIRANDAIPELLGLATFPNEPGLTDFDYSIIPGHLGEVWIGSGANQFLTLTGAELELRNNLDTRNHEFGSSYPRALAPGKREVNSSFSLFTQDDSQTLQLYSAAKERSPLSSMLQLGQKNGQLMGIYMPAVTPELPAYVDSATRLQWEFRNNLAQGTNNDELYVAFA